MFHINFKKNDGLPAIQSKALQAGQTIIEAVIALASILLTLAAISVAITTSLDNSTFIKNQTLASKYAQQGIEALRYLRNTDSTTFEAKQGIYCLNEDNTLTIGSCGTVNIAGQFKREAEFIQAIPTPDPSLECGGGTQVTVTVSWSSSKCSSANRFCHQSQLVSCFSKVSNSGSKL